MTDGFTRCNFGTEPFGLFLNFFLGIQMDMSPADHEVASVGRMVLPTEAPTLLVELQT